jgi:2,3-dihydroxybenzoate decarboxylase
MSATARVIALEEHFSHPDLLGPVPPAWAERLLDMNELRLREMDEASIDIQVLSHFPSGPQNLPPEEAVRLSRASNEIIHRAIGAHPDRFAGFAGLPLSAPEEAAAELRRAVNELGFKGVMLHGMGAGVPLDDRRFWGIWAEAEALDVPVYLHPDVSPDAVVDAYYKDYPALIGPGWSYTVETATQAMRVMLSGLLDAHPRLKLILGHLGESLPFSIVRCDAMVSRRAQLKRPLKDYFHDHFWVTTAGNFSNSALVCCLLEMGADHVLFSVDWPFASNVEAVRFLEHASIGPHDRAKIFGATAAALLKL